VPAFDTMPHASRSSRQLILLALLLGSLPIVAININYLLAASEGHVPWCVPYWDSCTSISATGRAGTAFFFFKATMLPLALVYFLYWRHANRHLSKLGYKGRTIEILGLVAVVGLACYILALGAVGDNFRLTRRIGIILYFGLTYLCQLLIVYRLDTLKVPDPTKIWQQRLLGLILLIGLATLVLDLALSNYDDYENAFEWNIGLLVHFNFLIAAYGWHKSQQKMVSSHQ